MRAPMTFTVDGFEFCRLLEATALFQARGDDVPDWSMVRCIVRDGRLLMLASNFLAMACGRVGLIEQDGTGMLELPAAQVKALLAVFKRRRPKDALDQEYTLEVTADPERIRVQDVSVLFDRDELVLTVPPEDDNPHAETQHEKTMRRALTLHEAVTRDQRPLEPGVSFGEEKWRLVARAVKLLGPDLRIIPCGTAVLAIVGESFVVTVPGGRDEATETDGVPDPPREQAWLSGWGREASTLVEDGVL